MKIFVSRHLAADSPFFAIFADASIQWQTESLVAFTAVWPAEIPTNDWIFFTSRQGVTFFFRVAPKLGWVLPPATRLGVMGEGTAKALREVGYAPDFIGNGAPPLVALALAELAHGQTVLFPRAQNSLASLQQALDSRVRVVDLVVYANQMREDFAIISPDALVFTSPLNVKAYFNRYLPQPGQSFFAIGPTTAQALRQAGIDDPLVPATPSEEALAHLCHQHLISNPGLPPGLGLSKV